jgi:hypothetical protein
MKPYLVTTVRSAIQRQGSVQAKGYTRLNLGRLRPDPRPRAHPLPLVTARRRQQTRTAAPTGERAPQPATTPKPKLNFTAHREGHSGHLRGIIPALREVVRPDHDDGHSCGGGSSSGAEFTRQMLPTDEIVRLSTLCARYPSPEPARQITTLSVPLSRFSWFAQILYGSRRGRNSLYTPRGSHYGRANRRLVVEFVTESVGRGARGFRGSRLAVANPSAR